MLTVYVAWALSTAEPTAMAAELRAELEVAWRDRCNAHASPYCRGLLALCMFNCGLEARGLELAAELRAAQAADGRVDNGGACTVTLSGGVGLDCEVTSIAILVWLRARALEPAQRAMQWLLSRSRGGAFGAKSAA